MTKGKKHQIALDKIHLLSIKLFKNQIDVSLDLLNAGEKPIEILSTVSHETSYNPNEKMVRIRTSIFLSSKGKDGEELELSGNFGIEYIFRIDNLEDFRLVDKNEMPQYDNSIILEILSIAYSTSRGIVLQKTEGTALSGVILPITDASAFL